MPQRDLSIGKHPLLIGRTWPTAIHQWTRGELETFLDSNRYPKHTWEDQQEGRRRAAVRALRLGMEVPRIVLDEDATIESDHRMKVESDALWARYNGYLASKTQEFEGFIGYLHSMSAYRSQVKGLMLELLKQCQTVERHKMRVLYEGWDLSLRVVTPHIYRSRLGVASEPKRVLVALGADPLGMAAIHSIPWDIVEASILELLASRKVTYDDVWFFTGVGWTPSRPAVVAVVDSTAVC